MTITVNVAKCLAMQEQQRNRQHLYLNGWSLFILFDEATKDNHVFAYSQFDSQDMVRKRAFMAFQAYLPVTVTHRPRSPAIQFSSVTVAARGGGRHNRSMTKNWLKIVVQQREIRATQPEQESDFVVRKNGYWLNILIKDCQSVCRLIKKIFIHKY